MGQGAEYLLAAAQQAERTSRLARRCRCYDEALRAAERLAEASAIRRHSSAFTRPRHGCTSSPVISIARRPKASGSCRWRRLTGNRSRRPRRWPRSPGRRRGRRNLDAAIRFSREALEVAEPAGALAVQGRAHFTIGFVRGVTGVLDESHAALEKSIAISTAAGDAVLPIVVAVDRPDCCETGPATISRPRACRLKASSWPRDAACSFPLLFSCFLRGMTLTGKGDYDEAFAAFTEGLSLAERVGDEAIHHRLLNCLGWLYADLGDLDGPRSSTR